MIPYGKHHIDDDDIRAVVDVLKSGALTQGPAVEAFEEAVAQYVGVKYAVAVSSGTAALHLANIVAGVKPGNSIVTSPITFVATANAARYCGGEVLFADVDPQSINMSPAALKEILSKELNVRAVIPVHFAGLPCDMVAIKALADDAGAVVIEDAAHALGALYPSGKRVGSCENSLMTIFSFHPVKAIAAGEGGMITTNDDAVYRHLLRLRSHGINKLDDPMISTSQAFTEGIKNPWYYEMQELGFHYRITDIQCALGLSQLGKLDKFLSKRRDLARRYDDAFKNMRNCEPIHSAWRNVSGMHLYVLRINFDNIPYNRAELMMALKLKGIGTQVHYLPVTGHPYYKNLNTTNTFHPSATDYYNTALSIPLFYDLELRDQDAVIAAFRELVG
jgi:UDP-4-amino-4,6-dideoxy-N-acetyl-beta-L-altrosamine transaminase